jgi:hypothetical protein
VPLQARDSLKLRDWMSCTNPQNNDNTVDLLFFSGLGSSVEDAKAALQHILSGSASTIQAKCLQCIGQVKTEYCVDLLEEDASLFAHLARLLTVQICQIEELKQVIDLQKDVHYVTGHSFGEIAAAYATGLLTFKEAFELTHKCFSDENVSALAKGAMIVTPRCKSIEEEIIVSGFLNTCNITLGCDNKVNHVFSGSDVDMAHLRTKLEGLEVCFEEMASFGIPFHSAFLTQNNGEALLIQALESFPARIFLKNPSSQMQYCRLMDSDLMEDKIFTVRKFAQSCCGPLNLDKVQNLVFEGKKSLTIVECGATQLFKVSFFSSLQEVWSEECASVRGRRVCQYPQRGRSPNHFSARFGVPTAPRQRS